VNKRNLLTIGVFVLLIPFLFFPLYSSFVTGVFSWHISITPIWIDLLEVLIYIGLMYILGFNNCELRGRIILIISSVYLISMGTFIQVAVAYVYIEIIIFVGWTVCIVLKNEFDSSVQFVIGSIVWGLGGIVLSLMKLGTIDCLRIYTIALVLLCLVVSKNQIQKKKSLFSQFDEFVAKSGRANGLF